MSGPPIRPKNSQRYKTLPLPPPPLKLLELENAKLKEEKKILEALVEVLCKQNLQYSEVLNQHKVFEKEVGKEMDRTMRVMAGVVNMQFQNHSRMKTIEKRVITDWENFCGEMKVEEAEKVLGDIMERIIEKDPRETEEVIIGMEGMI